MLIVFSAVEDRIPYRTLTMLVETKTAVRKPLNHDVWKLATGAV